MQDNTLTISIHNLLCVWYATRYANAIYIWNGYHNLGNKNKEKDICYFIVQDNTQNIFCTFGFWQEKKIDWSVVRTWKCKVKCHYLRSACFFLNLQNTLLPLTEERRSSHLILLLHKTCLDFITCIITPIEFKNEN